MALGVLRNIANFERDDSLALKLRLKTVDFFKELISTLPRPLKILDVGGTEIFWERMKITNEKNIKVTLLNLKAVETKFPNFASIAGDARNMSEFKDSQFDVVFSNSVIEHVGGYSDQQQMAAEIKRVGKRYFLQTPNYYFPFEPHFLFPFFQFFPDELKTNLVLRMNIGWHDKKPSRKEAEDEINSIRLLRKSELNDLFHGAKIYNERILGMTIFFIVYNGWENSQTK